MKSIFKKIALVLVLAMVVTMLPAKSVSVSAADASANKWTRKTCTLYIDSPVEGDKDGIYVSAAYATAAPKVTDPEGWKAEGYSVAFTSADETIATVGAKYGLVEAVGIGQTTITATYSKEGAEDVVESFPVTVKRAAASVALDGESTKAVQELVVGADPVELKAVMTDAAGNVEVVEKTSDNGGKLSELLSEGRQFVTDYLKYDVKNPEDKEVLKVEGNKLSAVAEGEATLVVKAYRYDWQSWGKTKSKYVKVITAQAEVPVTVKAAGLIEGSATQKTLSTFEVTASNAATAKAIAEAKITDELHLTVSRKISESLTINALGITKIAVKSDAEPTILVVTLDDQIVADSEYTASYGNTTAKFTGVQAIPVSIEITTTEAKVNEDTQVKVAVKTIEGVDIADSVKDNISLSAGDDSTDYYLDTMNKTILFWEVGKTAKVTAMYDMGWDEVKNEKKEDLKVTQSITCVSQTTTTLNLVDGFAVLPESAPSWQRSNDSVKGLTFTKATINLAVGDDYHLYAKYSTTGDKTEDAYIFDDSAFGSDGIELISSNQQILNIVGNRLYPQQAGSASVTVKRNGQTIGVAYINIVAKRYLEKVTVTPDKRNLSSVGNDFITVEVKAWDQLGAEIYYGDTNSLFEIKDNGTNSTCVTIPAYTTGTNKITINPLTITKEESVIVRLSISYGGVTRPYQFSIRVSAVAGGTKAVNGYNITVSKNELDAKLGSETQVTEIKVEELVDGFRKDFYSGVLTSISALNDEAIYNTTTRKYNTGMYVQVSKDGKSFKDYVKENQFTALIAEKGVTTISGSAITVSGSAIAAPSGTYLVRVYQVDSNGNAPKVLGTTTFTVKDSTVIQAVVKSSEIDLGDNTATSTNVAAALRNAVNLKVNWWQEISSGTKATDEITYTITDCKLSNASTGAGAYYVTTIIVTAEKNGMSVKYEVPVNQLFRKK